MKSRHKLRAWAPSIGVVFLGLQGCSRCAEQQLKPSSSEKVTPAESTWEYSSTPVGRMNVVVTVPQRGAGARFPVLVAFHGRGEALKGPARGARGWVEDYQLPGAERKLESAPLSSEDFLGFVDAGRLKHLNESLQAEPFQGLIVVCPYLPDRLLSEDLFGGAELLAKFLLDEILPRVHHEMPALAEASATGIDGVSLGGRASLAIGLLHPEAFGAVAGIQAAFSREAGPDIARRMAAARKKNPALKLRLLTSRGDAFLAANQAISEAAHALGVPHQLDIVPGPHDYSFNRGPGALEMLVYHDRVLRGRPAP